jgi:rhodanese-related sulfurtransferase
MRNCHPAILAAAALALAVGGGAAELPQATAPKSVTADEVKAKLTDPGTVIVDVRTATEFAAGHIPGAKSIPLQDLEKRLGEIDKAKQVIVYCQAGGRSAAAQRLLTGKGFPAVANYEGSWDDWSSRGYPSAKP